MRPNSDSSLLSDLRAMPRGFWVLVVGMFINRFGSFVYPFLTIFLSGRGLSLGDIGLVVAGYGGGGLLASLGGGWFADRFGRRNTIVLGTVANAACVFSLYFAYHLPALVFLTLGAGFTGGFYGPAAGALVADLIPEERRLTAYAVFRQAANAGFAFGTAAGGFLVGHSKFWLFAGDGLTTASFGIIALLLLPHGLRATSTQSRWSEAIAHLRKDQRFWALYGAQFLCALVFSQFTTSYAMDVSRRGLHLGTLAPEQIYGTLIGWNGLMVLLVELPLTRLTQRFDARHVMCLGYALIGAGFAFPLWAKDLPSLFLGMTVFTLGETLALPMMSTRVAELAPEPMRGRYMGALSTSWSAASMVGPGLGLLCYGWSPSALWIICAGLGGVAAFIMARWGDQPPRRVIASNSEPVLEAVE